MGFLPEKSMPRAVTVEREEMSLEFFFSNSRKIISQ